jgi:hypothetical protein
MVGDREPNESTVNVFRIQSGSSEMHSTLSSLDSNESDCLSQKKVVQGRVKCLDIIISFQWSSSMDVIGVFAPPHRQRELFDTTAISRINKSMNEQ